MPAPAVLQRLRTVGEIVELGDIGEIREELLRTVQREKDLDVDLLLSLKVAASSATSGTSNVGALSSAQRMLREVNTNELARRITKQCQLADEVTEHVRVLDESASRAQLCLSRVSNLLDLRKCTKGMQAALSGSHPDIPNAVKHWKWYIEALPLLPESHESSPQQTLMNEAGARLLDELQGSMQAAVETGDTPALYLACEQLTQIDQAGNAQKHLIKFIRDEVTVVAADVLNKAIIEAKEQASIYRSGGGHARATGGAAAAAFEASLSTLLNTTASLIKRHVEQTACAFGTNGINGNDSRVAKFCRFLLHDLNEECDKGATKLLRAYMKHRKLHKRAEIVSNDQARKVERGEVAVSESDVASLDQVLDEAAVITQHCETYTRFVSSMASQLAVTSSSGSKQIIDERLDCSHNNDDDENGKFLSVEDMVPYDSSIRRALQEMAGLFIVLDGFFLWAGMAKAARIEELAGPSGVGEIRYSSAVEDAFFVVQKCAQRSLATGHDIEDLLTLFFPKRVKNIEKFRFPDVCDASNDSPNRIVKKQLLATSTETKSHASSLYPFTNLTESEQNTRHLLGIDLWECCITINSICISSGYINTLLKQLHTDVVETFGGNTMMDTMSDVSAQEGLNNNKSSMILRRLLASLRELEGSRNAMQHAQRVAVSRLCDALTIRALITRASSPGCPAFEYNLDEEGFEARNNLDPFNSFILLPLTRKLKLYKSALTQESMSLLSSTAAERIQRNMFRILCKRKFTQLGALQLDKDIRRLVTLLSLYLGRAVAREKYDRLLHLVMILSLDKPTQDAVNEARGYQKNVGGSKSNDSTIQDTVEGMSASEVKKLLCCRVDFKNSDIKALHW